ncbi:MAG: GGDEF domain-containing protein, partial [Deltaproteobacteria bacterium]|nr:GGDEF domain-containing protein [Deltaproteobacteria bacterium]
MNSASFLGLVQNAALLLAVAFLFDVVAIRWRTTRSSLRQATVGLALGAIGVTVMLTPWTFAPGIVFDTRSVLLGISGLFFGSFSTAIAMAMTAAFRFYQGGAGAWTGIAVILISGTIGIVWRRIGRRPLTEISWRELYLFDMPSGSMSLRYFLQQQFRIPAEYSQDVIQVMGDSAGQLTQ